MKILFIHQNFPGQFKYLAPALVRSGHEVTTLTLQKHRTSHWHGVRLWTYKPLRGTTPNIHPWVIDFETKVIRGEAVFRAALQLQKQGYTPDIIIAHHGWGESLFLKEVWPQARLGIYCEFYYNPTGADLGFDPEFPRQNIGDNCRLMLKNISNIIHMSNADAAISPTQWQASTFPEPFRSKIVVIHDGIDTNINRPNPYAKVAFHGIPPLNRKDEVITFINRNLEPYRGYHVFMRALPTILTKRPNARVVIVGGNEVSYGAPPPHGQNWKDIFFTEAKDRIAKKDLERLHFVGKIPYQQFTALLQVSTVHVYLTYPFVLSWSLLEAMSAGCAVVASNTQPVQEVITHQETGLLVNFFDIETLAAQVCDLLDSQSERERLGRNARVFVQEKYDLSNICLPRQIQWVESL